MGVLLADEDHIDVPSQVQVIRLGSEHDLEAIAHRLFASLRELEQAGVGVILARTFATRGKGRAIADRLRRAAAGNVTQVGRDD